MCSVDTLQDLHSHKDVSGMCFALEKEWYISVIGSYITDYSIVPKNNAAFAIKNIGYCVPVYR